MTWFRVQLRQINALSLCYALQFLHATRCSNGRLSNMLENIREASRQNNVVANDSVWWSHLTYSTCVDVDVRVTWLFIIYYKDVSEKVV